MDEIDNEQENKMFNMDEDEMFLEHVVQNDHQLLYLDTYLREIYRS